MKTSTKQARNSRPTISKIVMALAVASVMGGMAITPAFAADNHRDNNHRQVHRDNGRHNGEWRGDRNDRRGYQQSYYYSQPVYAPPPVYYDPQPSAGISLVFPLNFRR
jgi:Ni/Co efflux regulator RcnB